MNAKKFLVVMLVIGLIRICHAAPQPIIKSTFQLPRAQAAQVSVYPCLVCPSSQAHANSDCLAQAFQGGIGIQIIF